MNDETFYEYAKELIDKWNLKVELSQSELKDLFTGIAKKAVTWEFCTSLITVIVVLVLLFLGVRLLLYLEAKHKTFSIIKDIFYNKSDGNTKDLPFICIYIIVTILILIVLVPALVSNIVDIISCICFPEKVVLEFISSYMK